MGNGDKVTVVDRGITATLLFNPWSSGECPAMSSPPPPPPPPPPTPCALAPPSPAEDSTYFSNTSELSEYVLNNQGRIWVGSADSNYGRPWQFAQFTKQALEVALYLLGMLPQALRADPVQVRPSPNPVVTLQTHSTCPCRWPGTSQPGSTYRMTMVSWWETGLVSTMVGRAPCPGPALARSWHSF